MALACHFGSPKGRGGNDFRGPEIADINVTKTDVGTAGPGLSTSPRRREINVTKTDVLNVTKTDVPAAKTGFPDLRKWPVAVPKSPACPRC